MAGKPSDQQKLDGFYVGYFTGLGGSGQALFILRQGVLVGADPLGVRFDGTYALNKDGSNYVGAVMVAAPPNGQLVQGVNSGPAGLSYEVPLALPADFISSSFLSLDTPLGPVNVRLELLRTL